MADANACMERTTQRRGFVHGCGLSIVAISFLPIAISEWRIARSTTTVTVIANRYGGTEEREARARYDPRDDVAEIYGVPVGKPLDLVLPEGSPAVTPHEAPDRRLLPIECVSWYREPVAERVHGLLLAVGSTAIGLALQFVGRARRHRASTAVPPPPPSVRE